MTLLQCKNVSKIYTTGDVKTYAVNDVSFGIEKGEFVSIMGPSGSGKSTLMHMLGLLDKPTSGEYFFAGKETSQFDSDTLARLRNQNIGFIFQSFNLLSRTSVYENVELPLLYDVYTKKKKPSASNENLSLKEKMQSLLGFGAYDKEVRDALKSVGMEHRINNTSMQLSGGEKQRVAIARALVNKPDIIFADEPTGNLDSKSGLQVMQILQDLNEQGKTIILVTHETYTAEHAKRIIYMRDGKVESDKTLKEWRRAKDGKTLK